MPAVLDLAPAQIVNEEQNDIRFLRRRSSPRRGANSNRPARHSNRPQEIASLHP
jgi:hypothetical protein